MPRPTRKKLKFDEESVNSLLQECYDDTFNIRSEIRALFNKWNVKVKDANEIQALGDQIIKLINAQSKNQDQKLTLLKYLKDVVYADKTIKQETSNTKSNEDEPAPLSRNQIVEMARQEIEKKESEMKLNK